MSLAVASDNQLIVAVKTRLLLLTRAQENVAWNLQTSFDLDQSSPLLPQKPRRYLPDTEDDEATESKVADSEFQINNIAVSTSSHLIAVSTTDKTLSLFRLDFESKDKTLNFLSRRKITRNTSCLRFGKDDTLFVTDKAGDIFTFSCSSNHEQPGVWILGHMSQVLDIVVDENFVITCDRDEKIKVSHYPNAYEIESYCLGHKEFVSSIALVSSPEKLLVSGSGDCTIRFWDYSSGRQLCEIATESPVGSLMVQGSLVAVLLRRPDMIQLYKVEMVDGKRVQCERFGDSSIFDESFIVSIAFAVSELHILIFNKTKGLQLVSRSLEGKETIFVVPEEIFKTNEMKFEDSLENLYKKKFDNVSAYHERKRRRIEEEQKAKAIKS